MEPVTYEVTYWVQDTMECGHWTTYTGSELVCRTFAGWYGGEVKRVTLSEPVKDCPQPESPWCPCVQYSLTEVAYFGTFNDRTSIMRDDAGVYWVGNRRFSSVNDAYDYAEAHQ